MKFRATKDEGKNLLKVSCFQFGDLTIGNGPNFQIFATHSASFFLLLILPPKVWLDHLFLILYIAGILRFSGIKGNRLNY
jgi:hypothetical protein